MNSEALPSFFVGVAAWQMEETGNRGEAGERNANELIFRKS